MARLALSDLVSHFKLRVLKRVYLEAPALVPSHSPMVGKGVVSEGDQEVAEVSALGPKPISPREVDSPLMSRDSEEMVEDIPIDDQAPLEVSTPLAPRGMCLRWRVVKVPKGRSPLRP